MAIRLNNIQSMSRLDVAGFEPRWAVVTRDGRVLQASDSLHTIMTLIDGTRNATEVAAAATAALGTPVTKDDIDCLQADVLIPYGLLEAHPGIRRRRSPLLVSLPLLTERMLRRVTTTGAHLFDLRALPVLAFLAAALDVWLLLTGRGSLPQLQALDYIGLYALVTAAVMVHEIGHLSACRRFRCPHGILGIGLYLFFPVFYVDVTETWRLDRRQRLLVDIGGMYFQILYIGLVAVAYFITRSPLLYFAAVASNASLLYNLHPFLKFDGYWILTDILGIPNLHQTAQRYAATLLASVLRRLTPRSRARNVSVPGEPALAPLPPTASLVFKVYAMASIAFIAFFGWVLVRVMPQCALEVWSNSVALVSGGPGLNSPWYAILSQVTGRLLRFALLAFVLYRLTVAAGRYIASAARAAARVRRPNLVRTSDPASPPKGPHDLAGSLKQKPANWPEHC